MLLISELKKMCEDTNFNVRDFMHLHLSAAYAILTNKNIGHNFVSLHLSDSTIIPLNICIL